MKASLPLSIAVALAATLPPPAALAHGEKEHARAESAPERGVLVKEQKPWGVAGDPQAASRTVRVSMHDSMRFSPRSIDVRQGETIRFLVTNRGRLMHEFVIGTKQENDAHAALMQKFPDMEHDEPYMVHVAPGKTGEVTWTFNRTGRFDFACLIPGHYPAMTGSISVGGR